MPLKPDVDRLHGLYAITPEQPRSHAPLRHQVEQALLGGARVVQYRDKGRDEERRRREAHDLLEICRRHGVPLIINDDIELAASVGADGVHLGRDDPQLSAARRRLGPGVIIGVSCYNQLARAEQAQAEGADYVAFGRFFPSTSKPQAVPTDLALLQEARVRIRLPRVAIGGITPQNGAPLLAAGADLLAVIDAVFGQADIRAAARAFAHLFPSEDCHDPLP